MTKNTQNNTSEFDRDIDLATAGILLKAGWKDGIILAQESEDVWHSVTSLEELESGNYIGAAVWFYDFIESPDENLDAALAALENNK